jgi:hypothetical protein
MAAHPIMTRRFKGSFIARSYCLSRLTGGGRRAPGAPAECDSDASQHLRTSCGAASMRGCECTQPLEKQQPWTGWTIATKTSHGQIELNGRSTHRQIGKRLMIGTMHPRGDRSTQGQTAFALDHRAVSRIVPSTQRMGSTTTVGSSANTVVRKSVRSQPQGEQ